MKLFQRLIRRHQTIPNTANQTLIFEEVALKVDGNTAAGFASHFESLASSLENEEFDVDHLFDVLLLEEGCKHISGLTEPMKVTPREVSDIIKFLKNGKAQDVHGLAAEHLKYAVDINSPPLGDLMRSLFPVRTHLLPCLK